MKRSKRVSRLSFHSQETIGKEVGLERGVENQTLPTRPQVTLPVGSMQGYLTWGCFNFLLEY